ncbi:hypothetical protein K502DRAFT_322442 [Neoconidiobolus thromboides FSU 785]|nr:hypothetical protein K502DRAFT_322442 [Neoconidiobolus thromboides FSU 785]
MKIDEPKTPFVRTMPPDSDDDMPELSIQPPALEEVYFHESILPKESKVKVLAEDEWDTDEEEESVEDKEAHERFEKMRRSHYNMKNVLKKTASVSDEEEII